MKVRELVIKLLKFNQEGEVFLSSDEEGNSFEGIGSFVYGKNNCVVLYPDGNYLEDNEVFANCDNCDHEEEGDCQDVREVTMRREFSTDPEVKELDKANWCEACRMRDEQFILPNEDEDEDEDEDEE